MVWSFQSTTFWSANIYPLIDLWPTYMNKLMGLTFRGFNPGGAPIASSVD